ncbi:MAG: hypothetical protein AMS21_04060 [Gemmatimonas sp. SG8_38_2]|nr:MAG: hypothetical protein AMS21_04060 [Gemmatimonas sp. SG8_38_2]
MKKIMVVGALLALPIMLLSLTGASSYAWSAGSSLSAQDTAQAQARMHMPQDITAGMRRMGMRGAQTMQGMHRGMGVGMGGMLGLSHVGPRMFLNLKSELALTEDQVSQLEKIHEGHHSLMMAQMESLRSLHESGREAQAKRDWDAVDAAIDEAAKVMNGMAKGLVNVERQSWDVLSDAQRQKFDTWQEGARLFRQQRMEGRRMMREGRGMQSRMRIHADSAQSQ